MKRKVIYTVEILLSEDAVCFVAGSVGATSRATSPVGVERDKGVHHDGL